MSIAIDLLNEETKNKPPMEYRAIVERHLDQARREFQNAKSIVTVDGGVRIIAAKKHLGGLERLVASVAYPRLD